MPPKKKNQKISLNEFLGDSTLGSWADEMDSLPSAPAAREDGDTGRPGRRDDFLSSRPDRGAFPPREDLPLPTSPPYTAFIGNLSFDITEAELEEYFTGLKTKSVKVIKDRDDKPKGFGYVEFADLDGLKDALSRTGSNFAGRTVRVSVAEPPKERTGFGGGDDGKFDSPWRRDGPLPDLPSRDSSRRRFDSVRSEDRLSSVSEGPSDWRSNRAPRTPVNEEAPRRRTGFPTTERSGAADHEDSWTIGSRFKPGPPAPSSEDSGSGSRFGSMRGRGDMGPPPPVDEGGDWRSSSRRSVRGNTPPNGSTPPTPQMSRRKLDLLPRSGSASGTPSPLSSPKLAAATPVQPVARANPFGAAKPVDVTSREREIVEKIENKERLSMSRTNSRSGTDRGNTERHTMSRTNSRAGTERTPQGGEWRSRAPPAASSPPAPSSPKSAAPPPSRPPPANVRPTLSFANAAASKESAPAGPAAESKDEVKETTAKLDEVTLE